MRESSVCSTHIFLQTPYQTTGKKFGISELGPDVVNFISHATQHRLMSLLEKVTQVAQLKNLSLKVQIDGS